MTTTEREPEVGSVGQVETTVEATMTAAVFARSQGESFPPVLATPFMIGEMERACATLITPLLEPGSLSVGVRVDVTHFAPTAVGGKVVSYGRYTGREGALYWFDVWSEDDKGQIGKGRHARAIANAEAIVERADARMGKEQK